MRYRIMLILFFVLCQGAVMAQDKLAEKLQLIEKSQASDKHIKELKDLLRSSEIPAKDNIAIQTVIVHQYQQLRQWDSCLHYCQAQIAFAQRQHNKTAEAAFYKLLGNTCYYIPDKNKAVAYWKKCIAISETIGDNLQLEQCYHNIGSVILETGTNYDEAESNFLKAIQLSLINKTDTSELGNLHYRLLATLYAETGRFKKADSLYIQVVARARQLNDSLLIGEALTFYSGLQAKEKKFDKAIETGKEALLISQKFNRLDMEQTALGFLSQCYARSGNYKEAYRYVLDQNELYLKRFNTDLNAKMSEAEARFKTSELQHENAIAAINARKEKQLYITAFAGLLVLGGFAFYYFYQRRSARQKTQMQLQVQEEKERLSRDLHDNLGSQMALLSNNIENLDSGYRRQQGISDHIDRVKNSSRQLLQTLRETIWILNKEQVSAQDFFDKLVDYAHRFLQSYPDITLQVKEDFAGDRQLNSNEALQLFRICQESITNSCKYSASTTLALTAETNKGNFIIVIADKGKGFNKMEVNRGEHFGLQNMQDRAGEINAELQITAIKNEGVNVFIKL